MKKSNKLFFLCALCFGMTVGVMSTCRPEGTAVYADAPAPITSNEDLHNRTIATSFSTDAPAITFFTHGLGGNASAWSNDFNGSYVALNFSYDSDSIIETMRNSATNGINMYRIGINRAYVEYATSAYTYYSNSSPLSNLDFSKHVVVVPEIADTNRSMENVYNDFEHIVDSVVNNYLRVKGKLPSINLVGHSMGGLLNMQYTINHPKNVASLVSLGTPYNGSWYDNPLVELLGIKDFNLQPCIAGTCNHGSTYSFCNLTLRKQMWNSVYNQNKHIKFVAICGETSNLLWQEMIFSGQINRYQDVGAEVGAIAVDLLSACTAWWLLPGDICVDSDSQQAKGFDGVVNYTKKFFPWNTNVNKRSTPQIPIPHNLETYDRDIQRCVLGTIDYGETANSNEYADNNGVSIRLLGKIDGKYFVKIRNNTGVAKSFEYNEKMATENDARNWTNLINIRTTNIVPNGSSTIVEISENALATHLTISYEYGSSRRIIYADNLDGTALTLTGHSNSFENHIYTKHNVEISLLSKYNDMTWVIKLKNNTGVAREFYYNSRMCFENDAKNWNNISDVKKTDMINPGESAILEITEHTFATDISISYLYGTNTRRIIYAHNLSTSHTMTSFSFSKTFQTFTYYGMKANLVGKNGTKWLVEVTNTSGSDKYFEFNQTMAFEGDAKNWTNLTNIGNTVKISVDKTITMEIEEFAFATHIAISYVSGTTRRIIYANNLKTDCSMSCHSNDAPYTMYEQYGIGVGIIGKNGTTWNIRIVNNTGDSCVFYYNSKMCNYGDAKNWTGLYDVVQTSTLTNNASTNVQIQENGAATSIAISYVKDGKRKIFYADNLKSKCTMSDHCNEKNVDYRQQHGIRVGIITKIGTEWLIELTNKTGQTHTFEYNQKLAFENDAKNWTNLNNKRTILLNNDETSSVMRIQENGFATDIAISYVDSSNSHRYVFYAHDLNVSGSMTDKGNDIDPNASSGSCVTEGTLITLADGTQKPVEELTGEEMLLVWNFETGSYDSAPIMFVDSDPQGHYEVVKLTFSDSTEVDVVTEHGFFDKTLNKFVYLDKNASDYIGHNFVKQASNSYEEVTLTDVTIDTEVTRTYSPVTYGALCYYVNGMLSMPGGIEGIFNIFEVDSETMRYDAEAMQEDISTYGLLTYEELSQFLPVSEELFNGVNGQYLNVAIGKGLITLERLQELAERYGSFFDGEETTEVTYSDEYIKQYIVDAFSMSGMSLKAYIEAYIRHYTGNHWKHIPSSVYNNAIWEVSYDTEYFYATVSVRYRNTIFVFDIQVAR